MTHSGESFKEFAEHTFQCSNKIISGSLSLVPGPDNESLEIDGYPLPLILAIDILSSIVLWDMGIEPLSRAQFDPVRHMLICLDHHNLAVQQATCTFICNLTLKAFPVIREHVNDIIPHLLSRVVPYPINGASTMTTTATLTIGYIISQCGRGEIFFPECNICLTCEQTVRYLNGG